VKRRDQLIGIITLKDIGKAVASGNFGLASDIMSPDILSIEDDAPIYEAMRLFQEHNVGRLIVTTNGTPKGVITRTDVLRKLSAL
jgi:hypothetical protein